MGIVAIAVLALAALVTATISGIIGMGGGILLLAVIFSFLPHQDAIPVHAVVQLASNGTRLLAFLGNVDWPTIGRFALGAIPGAAIGATLLFAGSLPGRTQTMPLAILSAFESSAGLAGAVSISVVLVAFALALMLLLHRATTARGAYR